MTRDSCSSVRAVLDSRADSASKLKNLGTRSVRHAGLSRCCTLLTAILILLAHAGHAVAATVGYLYVLVDVTGSNNRLYGFEVDASGTLTLVPGMPFGTDGPGSSNFGTQRVAYDPIQQRLFVVADGLNFVSAFAVDLATGKLTGQSGPSLGPGNWNCLAVHPSGSSIVVGNGFDGRLASFSVPADTPPLGSPFSTGSARPFSCAFSRDGAFVYTGGNGNTNSGGTTIAGFSVNPITGNLVALPGSPFDVGVNVAASYVTDSAGRLFTADFFGGLLRAFTTSGGVITSVSASPFTSGLGQPTHGVLHPAGFYILSDFAGNRIGVYQVGGTGAATMLTAVANSPFLSGGTGTRVLALNESGDLLFAANSTSHNITVFGVDSDSGQLANLLTQMPNTLGTTGTITGMSFVPVPHSLVAAPSIGKAFQPASIAVSGSSILTFTLANSAATPQTGVRFSDPLPLGMLVAMPDNAVTSCGGTVTAAAGSSSITFADGSIAANETCTVSVTITGVSPGVLTNTTGKVISTEGGEGNAATATLTVTSSSLQSISLSPFNSSIPLGTPVAFTATGRYSDGSFKNLTDSVTWASTSDVASITAQGVATGLARGATTITATLDGITGSTNLTVAPAITSTMLTSSPNPSTVGLPVTFSARITGFDPTGNVTFTDGGGILLGTATLDSTGVAAFTIATLVSGIHGIKASYSGDANNGPSISASLPQTVNKVSPVVVLTSSPNPSGRGQAVTLTATVTGFSPSGGVTFTDVTGDGSVLLGGSPLINGVAAIRTTALAVGAHSIIASYIGDPNNLFAASQPLTQTVSLSDTTTSLTASPNPSKVGDLVVLTATVAGFGPTGSVTFTVDKDALVIGPVILAARATALLTGLLPGVHSIVASYSGDSNNKPSDSPAVTQVVNVGAGKVPTKTMLTVSTHDATIDDVVTLTAIVQGASPTGFVRFDDGNTVLGSVRLDAQSVGTIMVTLSKQGTRQISATYSGDGNNLPSSSPKEKIQVN